MDFHSYRLLRLLLRNALTDRNASREMFMMDIDHSYYHEEAE